MSSPSPSAPARNSWQREVSIAAVAIGFGVLVLPFAIYLVGQRLLGEYRPDAGVMALAESIWLDLISLRGAAWFLVLSPYLTLQLVRWLRRVWRPKPL